MAAAIAGGEGLCQFAEAGAPSRWAGRAGRPDLGLLAASFLGLRHLVLDTGAGYELKVNRFWAVMTLVGSLFATAVTWYLLVGVGK